MKIIRLIVNVLFLIIAIPMWGMMFLLRIYTNIFHPIIKIFTKKLQIKTYKWFSEIHNLFVDLIDNY